MKRQRLGDLNGSWGGGGGGGGGGALGQFLLDMCRWPLRASTPLKYMLWPIIDPILVAFGKICNFRDPSLVTLLISIFTNLPIF